MTVAEFQSKVQPELVERWQQRCFCASSQFCKLVSYDFRDYGHDVSALGDAELLIDTIIRQRFQPLAEVVQVQGAWVQEWQCPQCAATFREEEEQFSIVMWRTFARRLDRVVPPVTGLYLLGFRAFEGFDRARVSDFAPCPSVECYLGGLAANS
jgi:hypothetical protein